MAGAFKRMKARPDQLVGNHEMAEEAIECDREGKAATKFAWSDSQHGSQAAAEALRRRAVQAIRHVRNRTTSALEILRCVEQPNSRKIRLRRRKPGATEARHH